MSDFFANLITRASASTLRTRYKLDAHFYPNEEGAQVFTALKGKARGQPVLVVGNGPSLNKTPLDDFRNVLSIGMNKIDLLYPRVEWRPSYVMCTNSMVTRQHGTRMVEANEFVLFSWKNRHFMDRKTRSKANFFLERLNTPFSTDPTEYIAAGPTVTYAALQLAFWMGADPVIIFGCDHSFKFTGDPITYQKMQGDDPNHFDPNYFKDSYWGTPDYEAMDACYAESRFNFEKDGRRVYDATIGGKLQVFEKISLNDARDICSVSAV